MSYKWIQPSFRIFLLSMEYGRLFIFGVGELNLHSLRPFSLLPDNDHGKKK
jgi:hypothetical protein